MNALLRLAATALALAAAPALAIGLADLSNKDTTAALKEALTKGSQAAVGMLAKQDGFLGNERVRIPLPESLHRVEGLMRGLGMGRYADELVTTMNRAAESAVVEAKPLLVNAVRNMNVQDAKGILTGAEDAATQYFKRSTSAALSDKFLPIVTKATKKVKLADKYNEFAGKGARFGLVDQKDADLNNYVTRKALDGLFLMIAEEEKKIRKDPLGSASKVISKVFGAIGK
ncbi:MAG: DUF4197 domain-containing protein [Burkholderiales bacterium]|nr:DUF4197 domain-containing protein [Burkholderiales bacterium]